MNNEMKLNLNEYHNISAFVADTQTFLSDIDIFRDRYVCDAKSILGVMSFDLSKPVTVRINSDDNAEIQRFYEVMSKYQFKS